MDGRQVLPLADKMTLQLIQSKEQLVEKELRECYQIEKELGEGTYGKVYQVCCNRTRQKLALKQLKKAKVSFKDFKRELNYSYFLSAHPNIVSTYAVAFQTKDSWVFLQELGMAGDLLDAIRPGIGIGVEPTKKVLGQLVNALSFMHSKSLCHRDIKPENLILFDKSTWQVKLMDFGLTCKVDAVVRRSSGNNPYTPPEICDVVCNESFAASPSTDVWQCGITMYCLLTGTFPWDEACSKSDKVYGSFNSWCQHRSLHTPVRWQRFSSKLLKLFRKIFNPSRQDRCGINSIKKYLDVEWLANQKRSASLSVSSSKLTGDSTNNKEAKEALQTTLTQHGIPTKVTKSYRKARITQWIQSINISYSSQIRQSPATL